MITQTQGQIYLSDQRGCTDNSRHRSFHTFNYDTYFEAHKAAFGHLLSFNEDTMGAGKEININPAEDTETIILPVAGGFEFKNSLGFQDYILPGQLLVLRKDRQSPYRLINPYGIESIHFIQMTLKKTSGKDPGAEQLSFNPELRNRLSALYDGDDTHLHIGKYKGRQSDVYPLHNPANGVFIFVIQGAFEVQERLLQPKDGLSLWDLEEVEFEALSNDAIILIVEVPLGLY